MESKAQTDVDSDISSDANLFKAARMEMLFMASSGSNYTMRNLPVVYCASNHYKMESAAEKLLAYLKPSETSMTKYLQTEEPKNSQRAKTIEADLEKLEMAIATIESMKKNDFYTLPQYYVLLTFSDEMQEVNNRKDEEERQKLQN